MKEIKLKPENLQRAWDKGCDDVKKTLETLHPDYEFEEKIEFDSGKIYAFKGSNTEYYKLEVIDGRYAFCYLGGTRMFDNSFGNPRDAIKDNESAFTIETFDNQKDFFEWALKAIS